jgi:hypothetical protein
MPPEVALAQLPKPHNLSMSFVFSIRDYFARFDVWDWDYQMAERVLLCAMAGRNFGRQRYGFKAIWGRSPALLGILQRGKLPRLVLARSCRRDRPYLSLNAQS